MAENYGKISQQIDIATNRHVKIHLTNNNY